MIGDKIRSLRHERNITQVELAVMAGLTEQAIKMIEAGSRVNPRASTIVALADALEVTTDTLLQEVRG